MKKILFILLLSMSTFAHAKKISTFKCIGMQPTNGTPIHIIVNFDAGEIIVNDIVYPIVHYKKNGTIITKNFIGETGTYLYTSFGMFDKRFYIAQFNAATNKLWAYANVSCSEA